VQAPAECSTVEDLRRQAFGDDRHLRDVAPVRRDKFAALNEVEPQDLEIVPRQSHSLKCLEPAHCRIQDNGVGEVEGPTPREIAAR
jgi:hypothetical protein